MANMKFANNANTTLASSLTAIATSMSVTSATNFPVLTGAEYFYCTLTDVATQTVIEIVKVTATSGTTWTIARGQDGTTGTAFAAGDVISLRLVRASLDDFPKLDEVNTFTSAQTANSWIPSSATVPTNGMYLPAANSVGFAANSTERMRIDSSGVGIGTTNTASALFVSANTATGGVPGINLENSQNFEAANFLNYKTELIFRGDKQNRYSSTGAILGPLASIATKYSNATLIADSQQGAGALVFSTRAATATTSSDTLTEAMRIHSTGGVSIGNTTDPGATNLSVTGSIKTATWNGATIGTGYGGTGLTTVTANRIPYGNNTSPLNTSAGLTFDGTTLQSTRNNNAIQDGWMAQIMAAVVSTGGCNGGGPSMSFTTMNIGGTSKQMFAASSSGTPAGYSSITDQLGNFPIVIVNCANSLSSGWSTSIPSFWTRIYVRSDMSGISYT